MIVSGMCIKYGVNRFVFSSSATVYGDQPSPLREDMELGKTTNPYGETKAMSERILADTAYANKGFSVSLLRYFNPVGAHESGLIGEDPNGIPNNLMPFVTRVARGQLEKLSIFGNDYDTVDGSRVSDKVYTVKDLVEKPAVHEAPSNVAILGRYIINPGIFDILAETKPGKGGEIQLTDALKELALKEDMYAYDFEGKRYDVGNKQGFLEATVEHALRREDLRDEFLEYLVKVVEKETRAIKGI